MYRQDLAFYLGEQKEDGYSTVVNLDNLFFCFEASSGFSQEQGHEFVEFVKKKMALVKIDRLSSLDNFVAELIEEKNLPSGISIAMGFYKEGGIYLKTVGRGKIYIKRGDKMGLLIERDNTASGPVQDKDIFIFLTDNFFELVGGEKGLKDVFDHRSPSQIIEEITPTLKAKSDLGAVSLFVSFNLAEQEDMTLAESSREEYQSRDSRIKKITEKVVDIWRLMKTGKKTFTFLTVIILFLLFIWSVILGFQRRIYSNASKKVKMTEELITQKLASAEEVAFLNMDRATILIKESKEEVDKLKNDKGVKKAQLSRLEEIIFRTENRIFKKEQKSFSEFFDLAVDDKAASGEIIYLDRDSAFILDKKRGVIYRLAVDKKSLEKIVNSDFKKTDLVAAYEDNVYVFIKGSGVYTIEGTKLKKVIDQDKDWGEIADMTMYNGNIYLLDKGKDEIWKYQKGEDEFGNKIGYFQSGQSSDLSKVKSFVIDGSIFLAGDKTVMKYTSGSRDGFDIDLPNKDVFFNRVFTSKEEDKVYLWDKSKGVIYVVGKTGDFVEQINSQIIDEGDDFVVYGNRILFLKGSKIYEID
ncbi:hypothetical protein B6D29_04165 [Microgenomates bacterium UTCPR1]|nr:MAG: hypothetical protein B6D29_04165 [Microgenomates bacterium UTCPR1]